jgi:putative transcriptional regulator
MLPWATPKPPREIDVLAIRRQCGRFGYGQSTFAAMIGVSAGTLRNWEQGRRRPNGSARALLMVIAHNPDAYMEAAQAAIAAAAAGQ